LLSVVGCGNEPIDFISLIWKNYKISNHILIPEATDNGRMTIDIERLRPIGVKDKTAGADLGLPSGP